MEGYRKRRRWKHNKKAADPSRFLKLPADGTAAAAAAAEKGEAEGEGEHKPAAKERYYLDFT